MILAYAKFYFTNRVVNAWNSLLNWVDQHWQRMILYTIFEPKLKELETVVGF